jgi:hypothetical protein
MTRTSAVQVANTPQFTYQPPSPAITAQRILVKPNLGYPVAAPVTVSLKVLQQVLQGIRKVNPTAEILMVEGVCSAVSLGEITDRLGIINVVRKCSQM